jgi:PAS domain S-box-containing protein
MDIGQLNNVTTLDTLRILRRQAEEIISGRVALSTDNLKALSPAVVLKLMHELQVHQIELEIQNEELRQAQLQLEAARKRYFDLYDLAPVSYCTVSDKGVILEANLAAAELLGESRSDLVGQHISRFVSKEHQDDYYLCRKLLYATGDRQGCELRLAKPDGTFFWIYLTITSAQDNKGEMVQRMVMTDITDAKNMALTMHESGLRLRTLADSHPIG